MTQDPSDEIARAGRKSLADELYDLRCALALSSLGEVSYSPARRQEMRERVDRLEPLVGDYLDQMLRAEDDA